MPIRALGATLVLFVASLGGTSPGLPSVDELRRAVDEARYAEVETAARALLAELESAGLAESSEAADYMDVLVDCMRRAGRAREPSAEETARRAVAIRERDQGPDGAALARSLNTLGILLFELRRPDDARPVLERAVHLAESSLGPDHPDLARNLNSLATLDWQQARYADARAGYERALRIQEAQPDADRRAIARTVANLGLLLADMGDYAAARAADERALSILESGPPGPELASVLNNTANLLADMGELSGARTTSERALALREKLLGPEHPSVATTLNNLATILEESGEDELARSHYLRSLELKEKIYGRDDPRTAATVHNLAGLVDKQGEREEARRLYERALQIKERTYGPDHPETASTVYHLAGLLGRIGAVEEAERLHRRALAMYEQALVPDHPLVADVLVGLAELLVRSSRTDEARALYERALEIQQRRLGEWHPRLVATLVGLGRLRWDQGDETTGRQMASRAAAVLDRHLRETLSVLPERQALRLASSETRPAELLFSGLLFSREERDAWLRACWDWTIGRRGMVLEEMAARNRAAASGESVEAREAWLRLAEARRRLAGVSIRGPDRLDPASYPDRLAAASTARDRAESDLARASARFREERERLRVSPEVLAAALPRGGVLVEVVQVTVRPHPPAEAESRDVALVLLQDGSRRFADLGPSARADRLVRDWREALRESAPVLTSPETAGTLAEVDRTGRAVREALWDPILREVPGAGVVFLVPDGALLQVDIAALPARTGGFLIEGGPAVHLLDTARDLLGPIGSDRKPGSGALVLGSPDFDAAAGASTARAQERGGFPRCETLAAQRWKQLPESRREVQTVGSLLRKAREVVVERTGPAASEAAFRREAPGKRLLHLATHAFFQDPDCGGVEARKAPLSPLLLSGLVLAGANHARDALTSDDGLLTAEEIAGLDLGGVQIAVLSACDTGRGRVSPGEGVFGLRRAAELAGVRSLVMSLWPVPDRSVRIWMARFHERRPGRPTYEAARAASRELLRRLRERNRPPHPYAWAGFVTAGDWRP